MWKKNNEKHSHIRTRTEKPWNNRSRNAFIFTLFLWRRLVQRRRRRRRLPPSLACLLRFKAATLRSPAAENNNNNNNNNDIFLITTTDPAALVTSSLRPLIKFPTCISREMRMLITGERYRPGTIDDDVLHIYEVTRRILPLDLPTRAERRRASCGAARTARGPLIE